VSSGPPLDVWSFLTIRLFAAARDLSRLPLELLSLYSLRRQRFFDGGFAPKRIPSREWVFLLIERTLPFTPSSGCLLVQVSSPFTYKAL